MPGRMKWILPYLNINVVYLTSICHFIVVIYHVFCLIMYLFSKCGNNKRSISFSCGQNSIFNNLIPHNITYCGEI